MGRTLQGTRILITGASSGIGRSLAEQAVQAGSRVAIVSRSTQRLDSLVQSLSSHPAADLLPLVADLTSESDRTRILHTVAERFDGLDVLVNNAGVASFGHFSGNSEEVLRQVMEVNFFAPSELIRQAIPMLTQGRRPAIVNVASMCGRRGVPAWSEYSASKFALCGLTEALRGEMARFDIDVLLILPGLTRTELHANLLHNSGRMKIDFERGQPPERVAAGILKSLRKNRTETVIGWEAQWILRVNRWLPRLLDRLLARRVRKLYEQTACSP
jgi:short-subunit dehydrogenase